MVSAQVTSERAETPWRRQPGLMVNEWQEAFELCRWCAPEDVKGIKVRLLPIRVALEKLCYLTVFINKIIIDITHDYLYDY